MRWKRWKRWRNAHACKCQLGAGWREAWWSMSTRGRCIGAQNTLQSDFPGATPSLTGNVVLERGARGQQERARQEMRATSFTILTISTRLRRWVSPALVTDFATSQNRPLVAESVDVPPFPQS